MDKLNASIAALTTAINTYNASVAATAINTYNASIAALTTAINTYIASQAGSVPQAQVDAAAATLDTLTASVVAVTPKA